MDDDFLTEVAAEMRRARNFCPLSSDEIRAEFRSTEQNDLTEEYISKVLAFATSKESVPSVEGRHAGADPGVALLLDEVSSSGLVSAEQLRALHEEQGEATIPRTPTDYVAEFARRNLLRAHNPQQAGKRLEKGVLFAGYLLLEKIGAGGMGEVFRALHLRMNRIVALKLVTSKASRLRQNLRRFDGEIKALAKLDHANIVTAYDASESDGVPYLVVKYIDGSDLAQLVYRIGPLTAPLALDYVLQAARGLDYAHRKGVIHRDVKPSNILVDRDGVVKISDLGLAKFALFSDREDYDGDATAPGTALGTHAYMSPEQAIGSDAVDARSDIYGLGGTLFFLLVGQPPAEGSTNEAKLQWHREGVIPSLRTHLPELPERLDAVFQRMLAKSPEDRPQSMEELVEELEACQTALRGTADPPQPKVHKWKTHILQIAAVALLALSIGFLIHTNSGDDPKDAARVNEVPPLLGFTNSIEMHLTPIRAGEFWMGAPITEEGSLGFERPRHKVHITKPFYMGTYEVNRRQYYLVMDPKKRIPERKPRPDEPAAVDPGALPVVNVSWNDAQKFCRLLSELLAEKRAGRTYRLPTEAEWEYCCRAGTETPYSTGDDITREQANFGSEFQAPNTKFPGIPRLLEVGSFAPNPFRLHDMHGNALEWCKDRYGEYHPDEEKDPQGPKDGGQRILRGGATRIKKIECRSAFRRFDSPHLTSQSTGFRVVCEIRAE